MYPPPILPRRTVEFAPRMLVPLVLIAAAVNVPWAVMFMHWQTTRVPWTFVPPYPPKEWATATWHLYTPRMGKPHEGKLAPFECFTCRKSFKRKLERGVFERPCPHCRGVAHRLLQRFKPPQTTDARQWKKVQFLFEHGFWFQSVFDGSDGEPIGYPQTLEQARKFVVKFKDQALTRAKVK